MERKRRLRNVVLAIIGVVALVTIIGGVRLGPSGWDVAPEIKTYADTKLVRLDAEKLRAIIQQNSGKPTLFFVYASWCPYCKKQFPIIQAIQARYPEEKLGVAFISIDSDPYELSKFLMGTFPEGRFTPYHIPDATRQEVDHALAQYGFTPEGAVPHLMVLDGEGKAAGEFKGLTSVATLRQPILKALETSEK